MNQLNESPLTTEEKIYKTSESRRQSSSKWAKEHKDKMAEYARNLYHKKIESDPEFRRKLSERVRKNKAIREGKTDAKPAKLGRPRKYENVKESV
jgi:hypothetical protein